ncbi:protein translocase subunit SecDF [Prolixibacter bellariivorans]|uniref:Multifunctional fusion protein n=2 Tax=Prolixibacter bellariivorans TaxID=314319 RepID=A0A5M4AXJ8_9BACT|nr:protein translocase subunit SecDF [Prolixibacter bellariivorans]GET32341.1 protein translocase subunit SecDF [Prolixibacter bellariivorans]
MQNKGLIRLFAILLALICVYQLTFTFKAKQVEKDALEYANGNPQRETYYLDSVAGQPVFNFLGIRKYTYREVKEYEMNLGLDLKGGMNVTLEISVPDLIRSLANYSKDSTFNAALKQAIERQKNSQEDFVTLFGQAFEQIDPNGRLAAIFNTVDLRDKVNYNSTNAQVLQVIRKETDGAIDNAFNILRNRIDRFGVAQPNIQQLQTKGRILIELPGVKDADRVRKLLEGTAKLEFWETWENSDVYPYLLKANQRLREMNETGENTVDKAAKKTTETAEVKPEGKTAEAKKDTTGTGLLNELDKAQTKDSLAAGSTADIAKNFPLFSVLSPNTSRDGQLFRGPVVGYSHFKDTARVDQYLKMPQIRSIFPRNMIFRWTSKPMDKKGDYYQLIALKVTNRDGKAPLTGDAVTDARQEFGQNRATSEVSMTMNSEGAKTWARLTRENVGKSIAIVLDGLVQSFPTVQGEITGGRSSITGNFSVNEAKDLANMLKSGKMPAPAHIVQEEIVGPTLGKESIRSGMWSFVIAFVLILIYMLFFYSGSAGMVANVALVANLFYIIGILASLGAVLTLPGIAGIVLTIGMSVDANVLIYERVQEELKAGKGMKLAIQDGYRNAYSAIIDGQVTTLLTGVVLYMFGSGPIKGFATTLIIGILTSMFTAIFITRLIFERWLAKDRKISFVSRFTAGWLRNAAIKFLDKRKIFYMVSGTMITIALLALIFKGLNYGIDFKGGRTYVVRFEQPVPVQKVMNSLTPEFGSAPEVKTFGGDNQLRITTDYRIDEDGNNVDSDIEAKLYDGIKQYLPANTSEKEFLSDYRMSSQKVGPTISDDIRKDALISIFFALVIIFLYILIRFRQWQYSLGAIVALAHDTFIVVGMFALFDGWFSFSLEVDQAFIAAILTVLGYSINDTVVVFDRIREYLHLHPKKDRKEMMDSAINSTLRRTFSTSLSTFVVLLAIFLFGGTSIKGFTFALMMGVVVGTYSSIFIATPIVYDTVNRVKERVTKKK